MTVPVWALLGFAAWTALLLVSTIGIYRWSRILTARAQMADFHGGVIEGEEWYRRATRAHANCIENLPVFGAIVFAVHVSGVAGPVVDGLSIAVLASRIVQSLVHVAFVQTNTVVAVRFTFFSVQLGAFLALAAMVAMNAGAA